VDNIPCPFCDGIGCARCDCTGRLALTPAIRDELLSIHYAVVASESRGTKVAYKGTAGECIVRTPQGALLEALVRSLNVRKNDIGKLVAEGPKLYFVRY
jgi:hypothetical protein